MYWPIHILTGVIINRLFKWRNYSIVGLGFVFVLCFLFHAIFDKLAVVTYQPPLADFTNPFGIIYHIGMSLASVALIYVFWRNYKYGITFSLLPDLDLLIIGVQNMFHFVIPFYQKPWIHNGLNYILDNTVPFNYLNYLPDNRHTPLDCIWGLLIIAALAFVLRTLFRYRKNIHF